MGFTADLKAKLQLDIMGFTYNLNKARDNIKSFNADVKKAGAAFNKAGASVGSSIAKSSKEMSSAARQLSANWGSANLQLEKHSLQLKDVARIVQGIVISQVFYTGARAIRESLSALVEFNEQLDYTRIAYSGILGSTGVTEGFISGLQEQAISSIFGYQELEQAAKKLLAYGISYKNVMYITRGLTNLGAMSGDADALDRISYALGQIYAKGKLSAEEMRQLANAYVPIQQILKDKFGLSDEDLGQVGKLNIPAEQAINAIVDYANESFGQVGEAAMYTVTGLKNRIVDTFKVLTSDLLSPAFTLWKSFLTFFADKIDAIRQVYKAGGIGGVFEALFPDPATQTLIRAFLANTLNLFRALVNVGSLALSVFGQFIRVIMTLFNLFGPIVTGVINALTYLGTVLLKNRVALVVLRTALFAAVAGFVVLRAQMLATLVVNVVSKAIMGLSKAFMVLSTVLVRSPLIFALGAILTLLVAIAAVSGNAGNTLSGIFKWLSGIGGSTTQVDVFRKVNNDIDDSEDAASQFSDRLGDGARNAADLSDNIDDVTKSTNKAKDSLLSFDEVFKLTNDAAENLGITKPDTSVDEVPDYSYTMPEIKVPESPINLDEFKVPDFADFAKSFTDSLKDSILGQLAIAGIGAYIAKMLLDSLLAAMELEGASTALGIAASIAKFLLGAFLGLAFDAIVSPLTDKLWEAIEDAINLPEGSAKQASIGATIGAVIGGGIGMLVGGLPGSLIGAAIGELAGGIVGLAWQEMTDSFLDEVSNGTTVITDGIVYAISGVAGGGLKGGAIGVAVGLLCTSIATLFWHTLAEKFNFDENDESNAALGMSIGNGLGTMIGLLLFGPVGAIIGGALGTFAGGFVGLMATHLTEAFKNNFGMLFDFLGQWVHDLVDPIREAWEEKDWLELGKNIVRGIVGGLFAIPSAIVLAAVGLLKSFWDAICSAFGIHSPAKEMEPIGENIVLGILGGFGSAVGALLQAIGDFCSDVIQKFSDGFSNVTTVVSDWASNTGDKIKNWASEKSNDFKDFTANTKSKLSEWSTSTQGVISTWSSNASSTLSTWGANARDSVSNAATTIANNVNSSFNNARNYVSNFCNGTFSSISGWHTTMTNWVSSAANNISRSITNGFYSAWSYITNFCNSTFNSIRDWASNVANWVSNLFNNLGDGARNLIGRFTGGSSGGSRDTYVGRWDGSVVGHATGGIFTKEHFARFAEGGKAEAVIPLENASAMQPFVDLIADGITASLGPIIAASSGNGNTEQLPPVYVGTLIADDRGLRELERKLRVVRVKEERRGVYG